MTFILTLDGADDGVRFVDNTLTTLAALVRDRGVPDEKIVTNEVLKFNASVSKTSIGKQEMYIQYRLSMFERS